VVYEIFAKQEDREISLFANNALLLQPTLHGLNKRPNSAESEKLQLEAYSRILIIEVQKIVVQEERRK
jgi:hypothetical protein